MDKAFLELLERKDLAYITVKEICGKAGVNRSTFYLHYETVSDLLAETVEYMHKQFLSHFPNAESTVKKLTLGSKEELFLLTPEYLRPYLSFVQQHHQLYRTVMENPAVFSADKTYQKMFQHIFDPILARFSVPSSERNYMMMFYLNGLSAIVGEWLRGDCTDPIDHVIAVMRRCVIQRQESSENI